jgi:hypothetical protein
MERSSERESTYETDLTIKVLVDRSSISVSDEESKGSEVEGRKR